MYDFYKNIAETNNWIFEYSRADYQSLYDEIITGGTVHLFVDPITIDSNFSDSGNETKLFSGKFLMLLSSDVDETYSDKYTDYIKPLIDNNLQNLKDELICSEFEINKFQVTEVINLFDFNLDGVLVNYNITQLP